MLYYMLAFKRNSTALLCGYYIIVYITRRTVCTNSQRRCDVAIDFLPTNRPDFGVKRNAKDHFPRGKLPASTTSHVTGHAPDI